MNRRNLFKAFVGAFVAVSLELQLVPEIKFGLINFSVISQAKRKVFYEYPNKGLFGLFSLMDNKETESNWYEDRK